MEGFDELNGLSGYTVLLHLARTLVSWPLNECSSLTVKKPKKDTWIIYFA